MKKKGIMSIVLIASLSACTPQQNVSTFESVSTVQEAMNSSIWESTAESVETTEVEINEIEIVETETTQSVSDYMSTVNNFFSTYSNELLEINLQQAEIVGKDYDTVLKLFNEYKDEGYEAWQTAWSETCPDVNPGFIWGLDYLYTVDKWGVIDLENDEHLAFAERTIINPAIAGSVVTLFDVNAQSVVFELDITFDSESRADAEYIITDTDDGRVIYYLWENYRGSVGYMKYVQQADGTYIQENEFSDYPEDDTEITEARSNNRVIDINVCDNSYDFENPIFTIPEITE